MNARPRKVTDDDVFAATYRAMQRVGPSELTLSEIAGEAGVTAAALSQRFGSKRQLLLALSEASAASAGALIEQLAESHASPLAAVRAYADCMAAMASTPEALARSLAYLQIDMMDPDFRQHLLAQGQASLQGMENLLAAAIDAGELDGARANPRLLARTLEAVISGSLMTWAMYQHGSASEWMRKNVEMVLEPHTRG
jgi:AcrR family transcriptional regulator